jgi:hypothetical protein
MSIDRFKAELSFRPYLTDLVFYALVLLLGFFQFTHYPHAADFLSDVSYPDLGRSLLQHGTYEIRNVPQTTLPPGLALVLALVGKFFGITPTVAFRVIAVATILALIASYKFLRRVEGRSVAFVACLLLASSPSLFAFNTAVVYPEMPYLLASMLVLLLVRELDTATRRSSRILLIAALGVTLASAVLIRSVGVALLAALVTWILASFVFAREKAIHRLTLFILPLVLGVAAQMTWSTWAHHHQTLEWRLPGYPESYVSQLKVKNGQYPELGLATAKDIPIRVARNTVMRAAGISRLLIRRNVAEFWSSPLVAGLILLLVLGLISSLRGGGGLHDWYFLFYEAIFLLWPWDYKDRFAFPILPLTFLYAWRGLRFLKELLLRQPRLVAIGLGLTGTILCVVSAAFALGRFRYQVNPGHANGDHVQTMVAALFWAILGLTGFLVFVLHGRQGESFLSGIEHAFHPSLRSAIAFVAILAWVFLVGSGTKNILGNGRDNLHPVVSTQGFYPEMEASEWIKTHEPPNSVVMAREPEFVFHYTHDQTVWFPPISNPSVLMDGIRKYGVNVIEVSQHPDSYWSPSEYVCFGDLLKAYGASFRLDHQGGDYSVYAVVRQNDRANQP